jgi:hypothetical protein
MRFCDFLIGRFNMLVSMSDIDDATGKLQHLRFWDSELTFDYMISTRLYIEQHGNGNSTVKSESCA